MTAPQHALPPCAECDGPPYACANCRRPVYWIEGVGWLHGELPKYAHEAPPGDPAEPVHLRQGSRHGYPRQAAT